MQYSTFCFTVGSRCLTGLTAGSSVLAVTSYPPNAPRAHATSSSHRVVGRVLVRLALNGSISSSGMAFSYAIRHTRKYDPGRITIAAVVVLARHCNWNVPAAEN